MRQRNGPVRFASDTRRIASCHAWARSITTPRRSSSPTDRAPKGVESPLRGASVAELTKSKLSSRGKASSQPHSGRMPDAQGAQRILQPRPLNRDEGCDPRPLISPWCSPCPPRRQEHIRISFLYPADEIDLLQRLGAGMGRIGRLKRGPELRPDPALAQARNVVYLSSHVRASSRRRARRLGLPVDFLDNP